MHVFVDGNGESWSVVMHVSALKRVRAAVGVDLYRLVGDGGQPLAELLDDPARLVDVLYVLCQDQAELRQVSDEAFGRRLGGDALGRAADAFLEELIDFFPDARRREALRRLIATGRAIADRRLTQLEQQIAAIDPDHLPPTWKASSGSAPDSSASTPANSPSVN